MTKATAEQIAAQAKTLGQKVKLSQRLRKLDQESWRYIDDQPSKPCAGSIEFAKLLDTELVSPE